MSRAIPALALEPAADNEIGLPPKVAFLEGVAIALQPCFARC